MYYSAKQLYHKKVNFTSILNQAVSNRKLTRAIAYVIKTDIKEEVNFHDALNKIGIEVKAKDLQIFLGGAKKGDWDIGIAMDAVRLSPKVDVVVLVSGDGDFKDLLQYLQSHGCRGEVIAFGRTASKHLKETADDYHDMDKNPSKYLIGQKPYLNNNNSNYHKKDFNKNQNKHHVRNEASKPFVKETGPSSQSLPVINKSNKPVSNVVKKVETKAKETVKPSVKTETTKEAERKPVKKETKAKKEETKTTETKKSTDKKEKPKKQGFVKKLASRLKKK